MQIKMACYVADTSIANLDQSNALCRNVAVSSHKSVVVSSLVTGMMDMTDGTNPKWQKAYNCYGGRVAERECVAEPRTRRWLS